MICVGIERSTAVRSHTTRRKFIGTAAALPAVGAARTKPEPTLAGAEVYTRFGVRPFINGVGTVTVYGGSLMPPEVVRAMDEASRYFVMVPELQRKAGEHLAKLIGVPAAMVTAGAASSITVATTACVIRNDPSKLPMLPDTTGLPNEVIQPKAHRSGYEAQIRLVGAKVIEVETVEELESAIGPRTAMLFYMNRADGEGRISRQDFLRIGKERNVPTFNDAAADVPPVSRLSSIVKEGFDLVAFSGGKGMRGPQSTGLLLGRKDLIEAAMPAISPAGGIGRGMKVGKEEIVGLVAAVERFLRLDHQAEWRMLENRVADIIHVVSSVPGVKAVQEVPKIANEIPHVAVSWDESERKLTAQQALEQLRGGEPSIAVLPRGKGQLLISVWMMQANEHKTVARRLREIFTTT